jgi:catechol 2,3-dioxygenase-like lactoylglutathione lyase family enzyme
MADNNIRIFRIFVPVSDLAAAADFYTRLLGMEGRDIRGSRRYFDCGPVILATVENSGAPIADHISFSVADLEAVYERARELNCLETGEVHDANAGEIVTRPWGERSFYARDPFGNGLCFVDENTLFTGK